MKRITIALVALVITANLWSQSPEKMSYQAVVRNATNALVKTQAVGMRVSILQSTTTGTAVYTETHNPTTSANGLVSLEIGGGTVVTGTFADIDWSMGSYFLKTEIDPTGGTSYTITGTSQLMSTPYALHATRAVIADTAKIATTAEMADIAKIADTARVAKTAEKLMGGHYIGESFGGGIIYYLYTGSDGEQHGLIVNTGETRDSAWQRTATTTGATSTWDGDANTKLMTDSPVANYVNALTTGGFTDWYLPSIDELNSLFNSRFIVNKALSTVTGATLMLSANYWSSTEASISGALIFYINLGNVGNLPKTITASVRAVRAF